LNTILLGPITVSPQPVSITISIFFEFWQTWRIRFSENGKKSRMKFFVISRFFIRHFFK
jgi:hypothetical protein